MQTLGQRIGPGSCGIEVDPRPLDQRDGAPGQRGGRIGVHSLLRQGIGHVALGTGGFEHIVIGNRPRAQGQAIGSQVFRPRLARPIALGVVNLRFDGADDGAGDFFLHIKNVGQNPVVFFGPDVIAAQRINQLRSDASPLFGVLYAAFEHVAHAQFACHRANINRAVLEGECRIA